MDPGFADLFWILNRLRVICSDQCPVFGVELQLGRFPKTRPLSLATPDNHESGKEPQPD
jgi:hypothetical protein